MILLQNDRSSADGSTTIVLGGTPQALFGGITPSNGYEIINPDPLEDLWWSETVAAQAFGQGSGRIPANGGSYRTPPGYQPQGPVSVVAVTTGHVVTARKW